MVSISYQNKKLIAAGTFHSLQNGTTTLMIDYEGDQFKVEFIINEDETKEANQVNGKIVGSDTLQMNLTNIWNRLGVPIGPNLLGSVSGKKLYMVLFMKGMRPSPSKEISYSFYVEGDDYA